MPTEADAPERVRNLLAAAFRIVDGVAGTMNGVPNEPTADQADEVAIELADLLDVPFDENWPAACADALTRTPSEAVAEVERLRETTEATCRWLDEIGTNCDMAEIVADGGVTAGMVVQQEAREQRRRLLRALNGDQTNERA